VLRSPVNVGSSPAAAWLYAWLATVLSLSLASGACLLAAPELYFRRRHWLAAAQRVLRSSWLLVGLPAAGWPACRPALRCALRAHGAAGRSN
jgi:hypothetical protein